MLQRRFRFWPTYLTDTDAPYSTNTCIVTGYTFKVCIPFMSGKGVVSDTSLRWYLLDVVFWREKTAGFKRRLAALLKSTGRKKSIEITWYKVLRRADKVGYQGENEDEVGLFCICSELQESAAWITWSRACSQIRLNVHDLLQSLRANNSVFSILR